MAAHPTKSCGSCTMCCKLLPIAEIAKPAGKWCDHCKSGCSIYETRPQSCRSFNCIWLQVPTDALDDSFRPDRAKTILVPSADGVIAICDASQPLAWQQPKMLRFLKQMSRQGKIATARAGERNWVITSTHEYPVPEEFITRENRGINIKLPPEVMAEIGIRK